MRRRETERNLGLVNCIHVKFLQAYGKDLAGRTAKTDELEVKLTEFYKKHAPDLVRNVREIIATYVKAANKEQELKAINKALREVC